MPRLWNIEEQLAECGPALIALRKKLHRCPELSHEERETAEMIREFMAPLEPDEVIADVGGHGLIFVFEGREPGPGVMFRCELDALPIAEINDFGHRSTKPEVSHKCGHDGHMAMVCALGVILAGNRPPKGRVLLVFQGAEETGKGATAMLADPKFSPYIPDYAFALHNLPGHAMGRVLVKPGAFCCASRGLEVILDGKTSHAAHPEDGISPMKAMAEIISGLDQLSRPEGTGPDFQLVTVVHVRLGEAAFGTAPGQARVMATLRTEKNETMDQLVRDALDLSQRSACKHGLEVRFQWHDIFTATSNHPEAAELIGQSARKLGMDLEVMERPHRWSEDYGGFTAICRGAMFALGSGERTPQLHNPDYDFPDELIHVGARLFWDLLEELLY